MSYVTAIYTGFVTTSTATFEIVPPDELEMLRRRQGVLDHGLPYLVAELEGYIVGFCYASQFRPREGYVIRSRTQFTCARIVSVTALAKRSWLS